VGEGGNTYSTYGTFFNIKLGLGVPELSLEAKRSETKAKKRKQSTSEKKCFFASFCKEAKTVFSYENERNLKQEKYLKAKNWN
jgi:hypothetical protein